MRASTLFFTVASLFLIGSHSLPQPVTLDATTSIKERQAHYQPHGTYTMSPQAIEWCENHPNVCSHFSSGSNSTTTTTEKRQAPTEHYQLPDGMSWEDFKKNWRHGKLGGDGSTGDGSGANTTTVKMSKWRG